MLINLNISWLIHGYRVINTIIEYTLKKIRQKTLFFFPLFYANVNFIPRTHRVARCLALVLVLGSSCGHFFGVTIRDVEQDTGALLTAVRTTDTQQQRQQQSDGNQPINTGRSHTHCTLLLTWRAHRARRRCNSLVSAAEWCHLS